MMVYDETIKSALDDRVQALEARFSTDVAFYLGEISEGAIRPFRDFVEKLVTDRKHGRALTMFVNSPGGSAEAVEKLVEILRFHYDSVDFVVPDYALSAATILCMSGDRIWMDYSSSLGPIDPQVFNGKEWVPALGYLDKVEELLGKAKRNELTGPEFVMLQSLDLAMLSRFEQSRELTTTLLKKWLVEYKFKNWKTHATDTAKLGQPVTPEEKELRAEKIARDLGDNRRWHSHGRFIGPNTVRSLRLQVDDYSADDEMRKEVRSYNDLLTEYVVRHDFKFFLHSRTYF